MWEVGGELIGSECDGNPSLFLSSSASLALWGQRIRATLLPLAPGLLAGPWISSIAFNCRRDRRAYFDLRFATERYGRPASMGSCSWARNGRCWGGWGSRSQAPKSLSWHPTLVARQSP